VVSVAARFQFMGLGLIRYDPYHLLSSGLVYSRRVRFRSRR